MGFPGPGAFMTSGCLLNPGLPREASHQGTWVEKICVQRHCGDVANTSTKKYNVLAVRIPEMTCLRPLNALW